MTASPLHTKTYPAEAIKELHIRNIRGDIECFAHAEAVIKIEVYATKFSLFSFRSEKLSIEEFNRIGFKIYKENERISILRKHVEFTEFLSFLEPRTITFRVFLPKDISCTLETDLGNIRIVGLSGTQQFKSLFGNVILEDLHGSVNSLRKNFGRKVSVNSCHGKLELGLSGGNLNVRNSSGHHSYRTDGGNMHVSNFNGTLSFQSTGGNINVKDFEGELKANTLGGNIRAEHLRGNLMGNTLGGNIRVEAPQIDSYLWLETNGGNIDLSFNQQAKLNIQANGSRVFSSGISNFNGEKRKGLLSGKINGGGANVRLKTMGGHIRLKNELGDYPKSHVATSQTLALEHEYTSTPAYENRAYKKAPVKNRPEAKKAKEKPDDKPSGLRQFGQAILALISITLLVYAFNTIFYFTIQLFNPSASDYHFIKAIFTINLINGFLGFAALWLFILLIERRIQMVWLKYTVLVCFTYFLYFVVWGAIHQYLSTFENPDVFLKIFKEVVTIDGQNSIFDIIKRLIFSFIPIFSGAAFYYFWHRSSKLNRRIDEQELQLLNLEKLKTKAQLNALEARINPHFLYNSLNSIAGLIHENPDKAEDMTIELSKLFRATTGRQNESFHSIEEEINLVKSYLAIEQMRFGDRLRYEIIVEPELASYRIPRFLLQPLAENAIKHGISKITENGLIKLEIKSTGDKISIEIHDNGPGFGNAISSGYGLKSVHDKLDLIYEGRASLKITDEPIKKLSILLDKSHVV